MSLKHNARLTDWFCVISVSLFLFFPTSLWTVCVSYFVFQVLGIGVGLHRIAGHGVRVRRPFEYLFYTLGLLTHAGPLVGSALDHARHHKYADTDRERTASFFSLGSKTVQSIRCRFGLFALCMDRYYYAWFAIAWIFLLALSPGILIGAGLACAVHKWCMRQVHKQGNGYRRYATEDQSQNVWWLWPLLFGDNWHNNHHGSPGENYGRVWWEVDVAYWVTQLVRVR